MKQEKSTKKGGKISKKTLWTRILCLLLALLMVGSSIYIILEFLLH